MDSQKVKVTAMKVLAVTALVLGVIADIWFIGMINQWVIPWSSLAWLRA